MDTKISDLAAAAALAGTETLPLVQSGVTKKVTAQAIANLAVDALVAAAPGALDTLNELAAALGDDADFAATITTALAAKQATAQKGVANGYASLDGTGKVPASQLSGTSVKSARVTRTAGGFTVTTTTFATLDNSLDLVVPAVAGDKVLLGLGFVVGAGTAVVHITWMTIVAGSNVNSVTVGTEGISGLWSGVSFDAAGASHLYTVVAGDIESGNVRFRLMAKMPSGSRTINASTANPLDVFAANLGECLMSKVTTNRRIDLFAGGIAGVMRSTASGFEVEASMPEAELRAAVDAAPLASVAEEAEASDRNTLRQQVASRLPKARAILADPVNAPDWTAGERKVILALALLDLARRHP